METNNKLIKYLLALTLCATHAYSKNLTISYKFDENGNVCWISNNFPLQQKVINRYNLRNQMLFTNQNKGATYSYNYKDQLCKILPRNISSKKINYYYSNNRLELQTQLTKAAHYIYGPKDLLKVSYHESKQTTKYLLHNPRKDVIATMHISDDKLESEHIYTPYGIQTTLLNKINRASFDDINTNLFGFTNQQYDSNTSLIILGGYRAYDAKNALVLKQDDISTFNKKTSNGFGYTNGNPINFIDPTGHLGVPEALDLISILSHRFGEEEIVEHIFSCLPLESPTRMEELETHYNYLPGNEHRKFWRTPFPANWRNNILYVHYINPQDQLHNLGSAIETLNRVKDVFAQSIRPFPDLMIEHLKLTDTDANIYDFLKMRYLEPLDVSPKNYIASMSHSQLDSFLSRHNLFQLGNTPNGVSRDLSFMRIAEINTPIGTWLNIVNVHFPLDPDYIGLLEPMEEEADQSQFNSPMNIHSLYLHRELMPQLLTGTHLQTWGPRFIELFGGDYANHLFSLIQQPLSCATPLVAP